MKVTSAEAKKLLHQYEDEYLKIINDEKKKHTFRCAVGENVNDCKTEYYFEETQKRIDELNKRIMKLRHAINLFNIFTEVKGDMTIDQVLVRLPQLTSQKLKLDGMRKIPSKERYSISGSIIDYTYTAYDPAEADAKYKEICNEIQELQLALDRINNTMTFEVK